MFKNLGSFINGIDNDSKQIINTQKKEVKRLAFSVFRGVVIKTPVKKGSLRASWNITENDIDSSESDYSGQNKNAASQIAFENMKKIDKKELADKYIIYNNKDYAVHVNDGTSKQAPKKFLEKGIEQGVNAWERSIK